MTAKAQAYLFRFEPISQVGIDKLAEMQSPVSQLLSLPTADIPGQIWWVILKNEMLCR